MTKIDWMKTGLKTVKDFPLKANYWYIVDFKNLLKVRLVPYHFINRDYAQQAVVCTYPVYRHKYIEVIKGANLSKFMLRYEMKTKEGFLSFTKYNYQGLSMDKQTRKSYRTKIRRRLRRMGVYVKGDFKKRVKDGDNLELQLIKNTQKVADSPNTIAKVIQVLSRGEKVYYYILKRLKPKKPGLIYSLICYKFDFNKTKKSLRKVRLNIKLKDLIIPYLTKDLKTKIYEKINKSKNPEKLLSYYKRVAIGVHGIF